MHERFALTGGRKENDDAKPEQLWEAIFKAFELKSLIGSSVNHDMSKPLAVTNGITANGLVMGHAYSVLNAVELLSNGNQFDELVTEFRDTRSTNDVRLIKLRNPWGNAQIYKVKFLKVYK